MTETTYINAEIAADETSAEVEQRLRRLEASVSALQDTGLMEERVAERVCQRLNRGPLKSLRDSAGVVVDAGRMLMPKPLDSTGAERPRTDRFSWMIPELWTEVRTFGQMLFDHRYTFSMTGRFGPVVVVTVYLMSWLVLGGGIVSGLLDRALAIVLAIVLYKIIAREVKRYRAFVPDVRPPSPEI